MNMQALWRAPLGTPAPDKGGVRQSGNRDSPYRPGMGPVFSGCRTGELNHSPESSYWSNHLVAATIVTILLRGR
jgi:hypothetical protein